VLSLWETGNHVAEAARRLYAALSSVHRWRTYYEEFGEEGLLPQRRGRSEWKACSEVFEVLATLVTTSPQDHGYLRTRWSSELLALELKSRLGIEVHATSVRRWLKRLRYGYGRAHPIHCIRDPKKSQRLQAIAEMLAERQLVWNKDTTDHDKNGDQGRTSTGSSIKPIDKIVMSSDCSAPTVYSSTETRVLATNSSADEKSREFRKSTNLSSE
jgi:transposase